MNGPEVDETPEGEGGRPDNNVDYEGMLTEAQAAGRPDLRPGEEPTRVQDVDEAHREAAGSRRQLETPSPNKTVPKDDQEIV